MSTQGNLANQEKVVVNGIYCGYKTLCTQGNWCVNATLFDWYTHRFLCVDTSFCCVRLCKESSSLKWRKLFFTKNMFVVV